MESTKKLIMIVQFLIFCNFFKPKLCFSSKLQSLVLSIEVKEVSPVSSVPTSVSLATLNTPNKVAFNHNVSLTVSLAVGSPPQRVTMVLDTGSELSWLNCKKTPNTPSVFDPNLSGSYSPVPCSDPTCTTRTRDLTIPVSCDPNKLCHTILTYADLTSVEGNLALETFRVGNSGLTGVVFGCMDTGSSSNPGEDSKTTGLLGMNLGALSFVSQIGSPKFSYCIPGRATAGVLVFGEVKLPMLRPLSYTPLVRITSRLPSFDRVAYTVQLKGIRVSSTVLPIPESILKPDHTGLGQTMVDSGTQFTFLLGPAYTLLKNEFLNQTRGKIRPVPDPNYVFQGAMDLCFLIESARVGFWGLLPRVTLMFDGAEMNVSGEKLLYKVSDPGPGMTRGNEQVYCFTFGNSDLLGIGAYVIGHHHQQNLWMEFDLQNSRVGLAEVRCDLVSQRLGVGI